MHSIIILMFLAVCVLQDASGDDKKTRVQECGRPDALSREVAQNKVRSIFQIDYMAYEKESDNKKKSKAGSNLAGKLLVEERKGGHSDAERYVLFYEAMMIASQVADVGVLRRAVEGLSGCFGEDDVRMLEVSLSDARKKAKGDTALQVARGYVHLVERAIAVDRYEAANNAMRYAASLSRRGKDKLLVEELEFRQKKLDNLKRQWDRTRRAREALKDNFRLPKENLEVGFFNCIWKGDWDKGIPYLAKGSEGSLQSLANMEMQSPASAEELVKLGDGWRKLAEETREERSRGHFFKRAADWYNRALPILQGLNRTKAERQLKESARSALELASAVTGFLFLAQKPVSCGGRRNKVKIFVHEKTGLQFVLVPGGNFTMGSPADDSYRYDSEGPQHSVTVEPFLLCRTECTQRGWDRIGGDDARQWTRNNLPIEHVGWNDCTKWCVKAGLRLPSEAEWEYACRAGTKSRFYFGDSYSDLDDYAWHRTIADSRTHTPGQKKPNAYGLYDMLGNVFEWCEDSFASGYSNAPIDGSSWVNPESRNRIARGGSWESQSPPSCRCADRGKSVPGHRRGYLGFRPACSIP